MPETPLKEGEKRASRWREAFGIDQTEIDALTTPTKAHILQAMLEDAFTPYIDCTLDQRVREAKNAWFESAQETLDDQLDAGRIASIRSAAEDRFDELREKIDEINDQLRIATDDITLPSFELPQPEVELGPDRQALVSFDDGWVMRAGRSLGTSLTTHTIKQRNV